MRTKTLRDIPTPSLQGRRCVIRVDFNVPMTRDGQVADDTRIRAVVPTLDHLAAAGARVVILSHLGRPRATPDPLLSLRSVAEVLPNHCTAPVSFVPDTLGSEAIAAVGRLRDGELLVLENTRFLPGETENDPEVSAALGAYGDLFVQDAFGVAHRSHSSTVGAAQAIIDCGGEAVAGFLLETELRFLQDALTDPERPFVAILGGAKISGKIDVVEAFLGRVDRLLIGGAMANTFVRALGCQTGKSLIEEDRIDLARDLIERGGDKLLLPVDFRVAPKLVGDAAPRVARRDDIHADDIVGDIGPATEAIFAAEVSAARTVVWNGPMGVFEMPPFSSGTFAIAAASAGVATTGATVIVGGGDSAAAVVESGVADRISHISTGGGAVLELLAGAALPAVTVLSRSDSPVPSLGDAS